MSVIRRLLIASGLMVFMVLGSGCGPRDPGASETPPVIPENAAATSDDASKQLDQEVALQKQKEKSARQGKGQREY